MIGVMFMLSAVRARLSRIIYGDPAARSAMVEMEAYARRRKLECLAAIGRPKTNHRLH